MKIRMFDCKFGDCFMLDNDNDVPLLVDFGSHFLSRVNKNGRYTDIYNDLMLYSKKYDFLLTHYHADHYAGASYIARNFGYKFRNVYIPNIWSSEEYIPEISLILLIGIYTKYYVTSSLSLVDFLIDICDLNGNIYFVERGSNIREEYNALWPDCESIKSITKKAIDEIDFFNNEKNAENIQSLYSISNELREVVVEMESQSGDKAWYRTRLVSVQNRLNILINILRDSRVIDKKSKSKDKVLLGNFGNNVSIVFQNTLDNSRNVLFTGDFGKDKDGTLWDFIENNIDKKVDMHELYRVIKIAHHGTSPYYHSYTRRIDDNTIYLIPNGENALNWNIYLQYLHDAKHFLCSRNNCCHSPSRGNCLCRRWAASHLYVDINI
ncbi:MAG: MBL fold metallo-hydrolase [Eubacterium sp.]|nr:MBL fold metallo-hydrolase [Eubacterium sp.]